MPSFLIFFVHRHFEFRYPELYALYTIQNLCCDTLLGDINSLPDPIQSPVLRVQLPSIEAAKFLSERGILIKGIYEVWGAVEPTDPTESPTYAQLASSIQVSLSPDKLAILENPQTSWRLNVEAFGKKLSMKEQERIRSEVSPIVPFKGPVQMKNASETFLVLEEVDISVENATLENPKRLYFLRQLAGSERNRGRGGARDLIDIQTLKRRAYIGPTSMESEIALLMCNMALVRQNDVVMDPFIGTGSVLIPCANYGALCFGGDIDFRVLLGTAVGVSGSIPPKERTRFQRKLKLSEAQASNTNGRDQKRVNVVSNFEQYGLPLPEIIRADNSHSPMWEHCSGFFDAIICDPPYGIRAGARKTGRQGPKRAVDGTRNDYKDPYIIPTQPYGPEDVMKDLLEFSARTLRVGGRLVYLFPTIIGESNLIPRHPKLRLLFMSEQRITSKYARLLLTMEKVV
uniref:tRNA (guanine(10)-N(2))-methyltransferase n=1 Tax=Albugo laibachii Nc14 TaxID=890382 RepID=F0WY24_9STRA|nr:tRNA guanosine2'Omethyltransferase putative [Albugo laibachii Nc14]|eukprot:CCA26373.1 tRNA guanosine2'Omethyltransferase putative [Albugo laibachii Nc14]